MHLSERNMNSLHLINFTFSIKLFSTCLYTKQSIAIKTTGFSCCLIRKNNVQFSMCLLFRAISTAAIALSFLNLKLQSNAMFYIFFITGLMSYLLTFVNHIASQVFSCDQNLNRCCELVELTSKIQGQLFTILNLTAQEGNKQIYPSLYSQYLCTVLK